MGYESAQSYLEIQSGLGEGMIYLVTTLLKIKS